MTNASRPAPQGHFSLRRVLLCTLPLLGLVLWIMALSGEAVGGTATVDAPARLSVAVPQGVRSEAILVPHAALTRDPRGNALVMVVDAESKVQARPVKVVQSLDSQWVVTDGLQPGERIIVEGLQKIRPGASVQAEQAQPAPATTSAAPAAK